MRRMFANGLGDRGSIQGRVIPKTQKMVFDSSLLNTQHYKVWVKSKVEQYSEWSCAFPNTSLLWAIEKGAFGSHSTKVAYFTFYLYYFNKRNIYIYIYIFEYEMLTISFIAIYRSIYIK